MTLVTPLYCRITRIFSARNSSKALNYLRRPRRFLRNENIRPVAIQPLLRPFSVISYPRHCRGGGATIAVGFSSTSSGGGGDGSQEVELKLSPSSVLKIQKGDITRWFVNGSSDAIVNPANERMLGGGGADGAIHRAAGPELRAACYEVPEVKPGIRCPTGEARITPGFRLPVSHVIHTVGPIYDIDKNPEASLRNAYRNSLCAAKEHNIQYVAFTAISCGVYGYVVSIESYSYSNLYLYVQINGNLSV
ncbi:macro domain-containing protein xcc3184 [Phtheirospermum japonicum]|uniref:Macro domain-containing protein xcc3184 n=1 Tax=Phtheirospermum japonicum TaxID=374723 RepID=A0A830CYQ8_9LAMI|nr:macro domain-containing protein xcc3184 [Phtheirospermum japonicum]